MLKSARFWIGIAISVVCLFFAFQGIQFDKLFDALTTMNYGWLLVTIGVWCVSYAGRVFRWQILFSPLQVRLGNVFTALNVGYFLSNILPARIGDIVRAYLIGDLESVSKVRALSTVVVERIFDGLAVVFFFALSAFFVPNIPDDARGAAIGVAVTGVVGIAFLLVLSHQKERGMALLHRLTAPFSFLQRAGLWRALESLMTAITFSFFFFVCVYWFSLVLCYALDVRLVLPPPCLELEQDEVLGYGDPQPVVSGRKELRAG